MDELVRIDERTQRRAEDLVTSLDDEEPIVAAAILVAALTLVDGLHPELTIEGLSDSVQIREARPPREG